MADTVTWAGTTFYVHDPATTNWYDVGGVYIFAGLRAGGVRAGGFTWEPYYIGRTTSFKNRLSDHERWDEARALGATHIHVRAVQEASHRAFLEESLLEAYAPPLNERI